MIIDADTRADPDAAAASDVEILIPEARARTRRRRRITAACIAVAVAVGAGSAAAAGAFTADRTPAAADAGASPGSPVTGPVRYAAIGSLWYAPASKRPPQLCYGPVPAVLTPGPPGECHGIPLRGLNITDVPNVTNTQGVYTTDGPIRFVGTYTNGVLTLTEPPAVGKPDSTSLDLVVPCPPPAGGWRQATFDSSDMTIFQRYGDRHPDTFGAIWLGPGNIPVLTVTRNPESARQEIARQFAGTFCVATAPYSNRQLTEALNELSTREMSPNRRSIYTIGVYVDGGSARVKAEIVQVTPRLQIYVRQHFPAGMIQFDPLLKRI